MNDRNIFFMNQAILQAIKAKNLGEVPVGCVIVKNNHIIARGYNLREKTKDPTMHAEISAISKCGRIQNDWRLSNCSIYITLEPCPMCLCAIIMSGINKIIFGAYNDKSCTNMIIDVLSYEYKNLPYIKGGILKDKIEDIMRTFFYELH